MSSRRVYPTADLYEEREREFYSRPRHERNYEDIDIELRERRFSPPPRSRAPPNDTLVSERRTERIETSSRRPEFLREDYGRTTAGPLVVRERVVEDDVYSRAGGRTRRGSIEKEDIEIKIRDRDSGRRSYYPRSERGTEVEKEEIVYRTRRSPSRGPSRAPRDRSSDEEIKIKIRESSRGPPPRPRSEFQEREIEEIRFRRGPGDRPRPPVVEKEEIDIRIRERERSPPRTVIEKDDINIRIKERERRVSPPRSAIEKEDISIRIKERERPSSPPRSVVGKEDINIRIRERERRPSPPRSVVAAKEDVEIRIRERERRPSPPRSVIAAKEDVEIRIRERERRPSPPRSVVAAKEDVEIRIRERERRISPARSVAPKEDVEIRIRERERRVSPPRSVVAAKEDVEIRIRERERRPSPPRSVVAAKEDVEIRIRERERRISPARSVAPKEDIEIKIKERERRSSPARSVAPKEDIKIRIKGKSPPESTFSRGRGGETVGKEEIDIKIRDRSVSRPRARSISRGGTLVRRDEEEWIVRRRRSRTPPPPSPPPPVIEKQEIIIRTRKERTPSPEPVREPTPEPPPPPPPLEPIYRPPIIQEVITHHRHIDHGVERARPPTPEPEPAPPSPAKENLEIEIKRSGVRDGKPFEEEIIIDRNEIDKGSPEREVIRETIREPEREIVRETIRETEREVSRRRSPSPSPSVSVARRVYDDDIVAAEADYYNRKVSARSYAGEAYNGATREWGIVDIPPGTERVQMDGIGGGSQEITWQRYNGERVSKFRTGDRVYERPDFRRDREYIRESLPPPAPIPPPPREEEIRITERRYVEERPRERKKEKMWTEITKDLVIKEAVDEMGYEYEETDNFFYVIEYLRYEDVLKLVELTEDIRRERRERIREIQWEREEQERLPKMLPPPPPAIPPPPVARSRWAEESIHEREYIRDRDGRRYRLVSNRRIHDEEDERISMHVKRGSVDSICSGYSSGCSCVYSNSKTIHPRALQPNSSSSSRHKRH